MKIVPLDCGVVRAPAWLFEEGKTGEVELPVLSYLIEHPIKGAMLFDAGLDPLMDGQAVGGTFHVRMPAWHGLEQQLSTLDVYTDRIECVALSHAHIDHVAGLPAVPNARVFIGRREMDAARAGPAASFLEARDVVLVDDALDVFGDGSVELFATPGHTCGHQSLRVKRGERYDVLAGDACYFCSSLDGEGALQPHAEDKAAYISSLKRLQQMQRGGDFIIPGHDRTFWQQVPRESWVTLHPIWSRYSVWSRNVA